MKRRMFLRTAAAGLAAPYLIPRNVLAAPGRPGANALRSRPRRKGYELPRIG